MRLSPPCFGCWNSFLSGPVERSSPVLPASKQWRRPACGPRRATWPHLLLLVDSRICESLNTTSKRPVHNRHTRLLRTAMPNCNVHNIQCQGVGGQPRSSLSCRRRSHRGRKDLAKRLGQQSPASKQRRNQRWLALLLLLGQRRHVPQIPTARCFACGYACEASPYTRLTGNCSIC